MLDTDFLSALEGLIDTTEDLEYALEAPLDVTGDTAADTSKALGPDAKTTGAENNDLNTQNLDSPGELLKEENADGGGNDDNAGGDTEDGQGDPENPEGDATGETGEEDGDTEGETGENPEDVDPVEDTTDDTDAIKKRRLLDNMIEMQSIIQKNVDLLAKCNVSTISANVGNANGKVISIMNDMSDIIYRLVTDGTWETASYTELMSKYVTLNMIFDITVKMLEDNLTEAEKERERAEKSSKIKASRLKSSNKKKAKNIRYPGDRNQQFMGRTPKGHSGVQDSMLQQNR